MIFSTLSVQSTRIQAQRNFSCSPIYLSESLRLLRLLRSDFEVTNSKIKKNFLVLLQRSPAFIWSWHFSSPLTSMNFAPSPVYLNWMNPLAKDLYRSEMNLNSRWELTRNIFTFDCCYLGLQVENIITADLLYQWNNARFLPFSWLQSHFA